MSLVLTDEQKVRLKIQPKTKKGNRALVDGTVVWSSSDPSIVQVVPDFTDPTGQTAWAIAKGLGVAQVQAVFEARRARQQTQLQSLGEKLEQLGSQLETARKDSTTDALTQLYNRRAFDEQLVRTVELASLRAGGAALLIIDLDHFKQLNDTYGHPGGDAVLSAVAQACVRVFKGKGDFVARYGGEELAVLIRDVDGPSMGALAERLRAAIAALEVKHDGRLMRVTASIGAAFWARGESTDGWLSRADAALYAAKGAGRNRVVTA